MGKFTGVLLASDFDNTLVYTQEALLSGGSVPALSGGNRAALEYFMAEGGRFAVATGRALATFRRYAADLPMNAPCVLSCGAAIYDFSQEKYLEYLTLDAAAAAFAGEVLERFPTVALEIYYPSETIYAVRPNAISRNYRRPGISRVEVATLREVPQPIGTLLFVDQRETLEEVKAYLTERGCADRYELVFSAQILLEFTAKGADKGNMVRRLAEMLDISMEHVYCVGDEANDLPMLSIAAQGFAPANCVDAVRSSGLATIVADARQDALAEVIAILDKKYA